MKRKRLDRARKRSNVEDIELPNGEVTGMGSEAENGANGDNRSPPPSYRSNRSDPPDPNDRVGFAD